MAVKVLVIGSGGREHAITWKLASDENVGRIFVSPGNAGTGQEFKADNVDLNVKDHDEIVKWCLENKIDLVVIGPEAPLAEGENCVDLSLTKFNEKASWQVFIGSQTPVNSFKYVYCD